MDMTEHEFKPEKVKESILLIKQKMCKTHDLIKQYTDKVRETDCLRSDLEIAKKDAKHTECNYKSSMIKTRELELMIAEAKQKNYDLIKKIDEYEITVAADKKNIQQLTYKIKDLDEEHSIKAMEYNLQKSAFEDKVKSLEIELKTSKKSEVKKKKGKAISTDHTREPSTETKSSVDVGISVSLCNDGLDTKPEVQEKSVMTDEFYSIKDDPYPLFCAKCEAHLYSPPIKRICGMMSACPKLIEPTLSPKRVSSPSCRRLLPDTHLESSNRNGDIVPSKLLSIPHFASPSSKNNNIVNNPIPQLENLSFKTQSSENIELRKEMDLITHNEVVTNPSSNPDLVSATTFPLLQSKESCAKKDHYHVTRRSCTNDLLTKNISSIKKLKRKFQSFESKMENQLYKLQKKLNANYYGHHCITSYNNAISLNPSLFTNICKNVMKFYDGDREICFKSIPNNKSGKCKYSSKKIKLKREKRLKKHKAFNSEFSWKIEDIDKKCSPNALYDVTGYIADTFDITEPEHDLCENKNNSILNLNIPNEFFNDADKSNIESLPHLTDEMTLGEDSIVTLHSNTSNNLSNNNKIQPASSNYQLTTKATLCSDENSIDHKVSEILGRVTEENGIKNKGKTDSCLLKRMSLRKKNEKIDLHMNKQNNIEVQSNCSSEYCEPAKKRRISHAQKALVVQSNIVQGHCIDQTTTNLGFSSNLRKEGGNQQLSNNIQIQKDGLSNNSEKSCKTNEKYVKSVYNETHGIDKRSIDEENLDLTKAQDVVNNNNFASFSIESRCISAVSELDKYDDVSTEHRKNDNVSIQRITTKMFDYNQPNISHNNKSNDILSNVVEDLLLERPKPSEKYVINQSKSPCKDPQYESTKYLQAKRIEGTERITPLIKSGHDIDKICNDKTDISKDVSDETSESLLKNLLLKNSRIVEDDNNANKFHDEVRSGIGKAYIDNGTTKISNIEIHNGDICMNQEAEIESIHFSYNNIEEIQTPISQLHKYINEEDIACKFPHKKIMDAQKIIDDFVKQQLERIIDNDWEDSIHYDVIEKLNSTCKPRIIAKCIVEVLSEYSKCDHDLNKSFTPPAPIMATFQQKIIALLLDLEVSKPTIVPFVQAGIEYNLFQLNNKLQVQEIDSLTRIYVALARIKNDKERVRIMCCDALYCIGFHAINLLFTVLTCWPDILPNSDVDKGILPKCIALLINSKKFENNYPKLLPLRKLISSYYKYTQQVVIEDFVKELLDALKTKHYDGLDTAIILIAKREGTAWTYKTIIQPTLLPMIINYEHFCIYRAFSLLGKLLRAFPLKPENNIVKEIGTQLSDLLQSGEGSIDQQEGITSALLSLSRHKFNIVAKSVMKWTPNKSLRPSTITQIKAFIKARSPKFWKYYIKREMYKACTK